MILFLRPDAAYDDHFGSTMKLLTKTAVFPPKRVEKKRVSCYNN